MTPRQKAHAAFASALILLCLSGFAGYVTIFRLVQSEKWVHHTYEVQGALGDFDWAIVRAGRARSGFVISGADDFLNQYEAAIPEIPSYAGALAKIDRRQ